MRKYYFFGALACLAVTQPLVALETCHYPVTPAIDPSYFETANKLQACQAFDYAAVTKAFAARGLTCSNFSFRKGMTCIGKLKGSDYPEEIAVIVPPNYTAPREQADWILHLHGHLSNAMSREAEVLALKGKRGKEKQYQAALDDLAELLWEGEDGDEAERLLKEDYLYRGKDGRLYRKHMDLRSDVLPYYGFDGLLAASGRDSLLIVPGSKGKDKTFKDYFSRDRKFPQFMKDVGGLLKDAGLTNSTEPKRFTLTGHSGAYSPIAEGILSCNKGETCYRNRINELVLFDAVYGHETVYAAVATEMAAKKGRQFVSVFIPGTSTAVGNEAVFNALPEKLREKLGGDFSKAVVVGASVPDSRLRGRDPAFIISEVGHSPTVKAYFPRLLRK